MRTTAIALVALTVLAVAAVYASKAYDFSTSADTASRKALLSASFSKTEYDVLKERYRMLTMGSEPSTAIAVLEQESETNPKVQSICHDLLHEIGRTAYGKYGSFEDATRYQREYCNSGYLHGLFEAYLETPRSPHELQELCGDYSEGKSAYQHWECFHGIGHGLMYFYDGSLESALRSCRDLASGSESCANGVYMEVFNAEILEGERDFVQAEDPFAMCASQDFSVQDCYVYVPTYFSQSLRMDYPDILQKCDALPEAASIECFRGVGAEAIKRNMKEPNAALRMCDSASRDNPETCRNGVISMYLHQIGSLKEGAEVCEMIEMRFQSKCKETVADNAAFFSVPQP